MNATVSLAVLTSLVLISGCAPIPSKAPEPDPRPGSGQFAAQYVGSRSETVNTKGAKAQAPIPCKQASVDAPPSEVCQIDINVSFDTSNNCQVVVTPNVQLESTHRRILWVIKQASKTERSIEFADFANVPPILFADSKAVASPTGRMSPDKFVAFPIKKNEAAYYFIFLQWYDGIKYQYCLSDPIINNDNPL